MFEEHVAFVLQHYAINHSFQLIILVHGARGAANVLQTQYKNNTKKQHINYRRLCYLDKH